MDFNHSVDKQRFQAWSIAEEDQVWQRDVYLWNGAKQSRFFGEAPRTLSVHWIASPLFIDGTPSGPKHSVRVCLLVDTQSNHWTFVLEHAYLNGLRVVVPGGERWASLVNGSFSGRKFLALREKNNKWWEDNVTGSDLTHMPNRHAMRWPWRFVPSHSPNVDAGWEDDFRSLEVSWHQTSDLVHRPFVKLVLASGDVYSTQQCQDRNIFETKIPVAIALETHLRERRRFAERPMRIPALDNIDSPVGRLAEVRFRCRTSVLDAYPVEFRWNPSQLASTSYHQDELQLRGVSKHFRTNFFKLRSIAEQEPSTDRNDNPNTELSKWHLTVTGVAKELRVVGEAPQRFNVAMVAALGKTRLASLTAHEGYNFRPADVGGGPGVDTPNASNGNSLHPFDFEFVFDKGGLASADVSTTTAVQGKPGYVVSSQPFYVARLEGDEAFAGGQVLARWPAPDSRSGWRFFDADGAITFSLQASGLWETFRESTDASPPIAARLGRPIKGRLQVVPTRAAGRTKSAFMPHFMSFGRIMGGQMETPNGPELRGLEVEIIDGLSVNVSDDQDVKISELMGLVGDPVVLDLRKDQELIAVHTPERHHALLHRVAVLQPWRRWPSEVVMLKGIPVVDQDKLSSVAQAWADFRHAVPFPFVALLDYPNDARIDDLALTSLGATGKFSTSFSGGRVKVDVRLLSGRLMRYRVEIAGRLSTIGHLSTYVATYERDLDKTAWVTRQRPVVEVTAVHRSLDAGPVQAIRTASKYAVVEQSDRICGQFWIVNLTQWSESTGSESKEAEPEAVFCAVPSAATNARNHGQPVPHRTSALQCNLRDLHFLASFDPNDNASPDSWPPLPGYDFNIPEEKTQRAVRVVLQTPPEGQEIDLGAAHGACLPVKATHDLTFELARGMVSKLTTRPGLAQEVFQQQQRIFDRVSQALELSHPADLLYAHVSRATRRFGVSGLLPFDKLILEAPNSAVSAAFAVFMKAEKTFAKAKETLATLHACVVKQYSESVGRLRSELQSSVALAGGALDAVVQFSIKMNIEELPEPNRSAVKEALVSIQTESIEAIAKAREVLDANLADPGGEVASLIKKAREARRELDLVELALVLPWRRPSEIDVLDETLRKELAKLENDVWSSLTADGLNALLSLGLEDAVRSIRCDATAVQAKQLIANAVGAGRSLRDQVQQEYKNVEERFQSFAAQVQGQALGTKQNLQRVINATNVGVAKFLAVDTAKKLDFVELANVTNDAWSAIGLPNQLGDLSGTKLAKAAGAVFDQAQSIEAALRDGRLADGLLKVALENLALGPFAIPALPLNLKPSYDQATRSVVLTGQGTEEWNELGVGLLRLRGARLNYDARAVTKEAIALELNARLAGTLEIGPIRVRDFALSVNERGTLDVDLDPTKIELPGVLQKLNELLSSVTGGKLQVEQTPTGLRARFETRLPPLGSPGFQILNLAIGASLALEKIANELVLRLSAQIASRLKPASVLVQCMGGIFWAEITLVVGFGGSSNPKLILDLGMGIAAALEIDLGGVIRGSAMIALSTDIQADSDSGIALGAQVLIHGELSVLDLITASVTLLLQASYNSDGHFEGSGFFELKIKLFFFTIHVEETVSWSSAGSSQPAMAAMAAGDEQVIGVSDQLLGPRGNHSLRTGITSLTAAATTPTDTSPARAVHTYVLSANNLGGDADTTNFHVTAFYLLESVNVDVDALVLEVRNALSEQAQPKAPPQGALAELAKTLDSMQAAVAETFAVYQPAKVTAPDDVEWAKLADLGEIPLIALDSKDPQVLRVVAKSAARRLPADPIAARSEVTDAVREAAASMLAAQGLAKNFLVAKPIRRPVLNRDVAVFPTNLTPAGYAKPDVATAKSGDGSWLSTSRVATTAAPGDRPLELEGIPSPESIKRLQADHALLRSFFDVAAQVAGDSTASTLRPIEHFPYYEGEVTHAILAKWNDTVESPARTYDRGSRIWKTVRQVYTQSQKAAELATAAWDGVSANEELRWFFATQQELEASLRSGLVDLRRLLAGRIPSVLNVFDPADAEGVPAGSAARSIDALAARAAEGDSNADDKIKAAANAVRAPLDSSLPTLLVESYRAWVHNQDPDRQRELTDADDDQNRGRAAAIDTLDFTLLFSRPDAEWIARHNAGVYFAVTDRPNDSDSWLMPHHSDGEEAAPKPFRVLPRIDEVSSANDKDVFRRRVSLHAHRAIGEPSGTQPQLRRTSGWQWSDRVLKYRTPYWLRAVTVTEQQLKVWGKQAKRKIREALSARKDQFFVKYQRTVGVRAPTLESEDISTTKACDSLYLDLLALETPELSMFATKRRVTSPVFQRWDPKVLLRFAPPLTPRAVAEAELGIRITAPDSDLVEDPGVASLKATIVTRRLHGSKLVKDQRDLDAKADASQSRARFNVSWERSTDGVPMAEEQVVTGHADSSRDLMFDSWKRVVEFEPPPPGVKADLHKSLVLGMQGDAANASRSINVHWTGETTSDDLWTFLRCFSRARLYARTWQFLGHPFDASVAEAQAKAAPRRLVREFFVREVVELVQDGAAFSIGAKSLNILDAVPRTEVPVHYELELLARDGSSAIAGNGWTWAAEPKPHAAIPPPPTPRAIVPLMYRGGGPSAGNGAQGIRAAGLALFCEEEAYSLGSDERMLLFIKSAALDPLMSPAVPARVDAEKKRNLSAFGFSFDGATFSTVAYILDDLDDVQAGSFVRAELVRAYGPPGRAEVSSKPVEVQFRVGEDFRTMTAKLWEQSLRGGLFRKAIWAEIEVEPNETGVTRERFCRFRRDPTSAAATSFGRWFYLELDMGSNGSLKDDAVVALFNRIDPPPSPLGADGAAQAQPNGLKTLLAIATGAESTGGDMRVRIAGIGPCSDEA